MRLRLLIFCMLFARMAFAEIGYPPAHNVDGGGTNLVVKGGGVKTVTPGSNITIVDSPTNITISSSGGGATTAVTNVVSTVPWLTGSVSSQIGTVATNATKMPLNVNSDNNAIGFTNYSANIVQTNDSIYVNALTNAFGGTGITASGSGRTRSFGVDSSVVLTNDSIYVNALTNTTSGTGISVTGSGRSRAVAVDSSVVLTSLTLSVTAPITGGGDLSANRTLGFDGSQTYNASGGTNMNATSLLLGTIPTARYGAEVVQTNNAVFVAAVTNVLSGSGISVSTSGRNKTVDVDSSVVQTNNTTFTSIVTNHIRSVGATFPVSATNIGTICYQPVGFKGTIVGVYMVGTNSGTMILDVFKTNSYSAGVLPSVSITASAKPSLILTNLYQDTTLTGWGTSVAADDVFAFKVLSNTNGNQTSITIKIQETN